MTERDTLIKGADLAAALGLLSRLPVPVEATAAQARGAAAAWAYPLAGLLIGAITALAGAAALWLGLPSALAAGLMLAIGVIVTGGLHEDGLADAADGLWGMTGFGGSRSCVTAGSALMASWRWGCR